MASDSVTTKLSIAEVTTLRDEINNIASATELLTSGVAHEKIEEFVAAQKSPYPSPLAKNQLIQLVPQGIVHLLGRISNSIKSEVNRAPKGTLVEPSTPTSIDDCSREATRRALLLPIILAVGTALDKAEETASTIPVALSLLGRVEVCRNLYKSSKQEDNSPMPIDLITKVEYLEQTLLVHIAAKASATLGMMLSSGKTPELISKL